MAIREIHWFDDFDGWNPHAYLSNFFEGRPIIIAGTAYATGEHAFQAYKTGDEKWFNAIVDAKDPGAAKALGRRSPLRPDWELVKYDVMRMVVAHKFTLARQEGQLLLMTGDALLTEGTWWGDSVWGVEMTKGHFTTWRGRNWLGTILMARRAELRAIEAGAPIPRVEEITKFSREIIDPGFARTRRFTPPPAAASPAKPAYQQLALSQFHEPARWSEPASEQDAANRAVLEELEPTEGLPAFDADEVEALLKAVADMRITLEEQRRESPCNLDALEEKLVTYSEVLADITPAERVQVVELPAEDVKPDVSAYAERSFDPADLAPTLRGVSRGDGDRVDDFFDRLDAGASPADVARDIARNAGRKRGRNRR